MTTAKEVMKMIKDNDVKYVDFRFTDPRGKWQHVTFDVTMIEEETFAEGQMFDGSSIAGWKAINESDMNLMPDPATACIDPFFAETTHVAGLRRARADHRRALQPRPARHRQKGRRHGEGRQALATRSSSVPKPSSSCSTTSNTRPSLTTPGFRLDSIELPTNSRHRIRRRKPRPPHRHQEGLLPGAAAGLCAGHAQRNAGGDGQNGREGREAPSRSRLRRSTNSA